MKGVVLGSSQWIFCSSTFGFNCLHPNISIQVLHTVLYNPYGTCKENLADDQEVLEFVIISSILMSGMFDLRVIL